MARPDSARFKALAACLAALPFATLRIPDGRPCAASAVVITRAITQEDLARLFGPPAD